MSDAALASQIRARAAVVQADRQYIGFFEWLHFAVMSGKRRFMIFGSALVDLETVFAPDVPALRTLAAPSAEEVCPVACTGGAVEAHYDRDGVFQASHFVLGVPVAGEEGARAHAAYAVRGPDGFSDDPRSLHTAALAAGFGCQPTVQDGDCGPDTMSMLLGWPRSLKTRRSIRAALAEALREGAEDTAWQEAWVACQELVPHPAVREDAAWEFPPGGASDADGDNDEVVEMEAEENGVLAPFALAEEGASAPADLAVHFEDFNTAHPDASFEGFVATLPADRQKALCQSYDVWAAAKTKWLQSFRDEARAGERGRRWPRRAGSSAADKAARREKRRSRAALGGLGGQTRERRTTTLVKKLALGRRFQDWRLSEQGRQSKAPYADFVRSLQQVSGTVPKALKMRVKRAADLLKEGSAEAMLAGGRQGTPTTVAQRERPRSTRCRLMQGSSPHSLGGPLQEDLWDWFLDIRSSVATYLPAKVLLIKAKEIAGTILRASARTGAFLGLPCLDGETGRRWQSRAERKRDCAGALSSPPLLVDKRSRGEGGGRGGANVAFLFRP